MIHNSHLDDSKFEDPLNNYEFCAYDDELERVLAEELMEVVPAQPCAQIASKTTIRAAVEMLKQLSISSLLIVDDGRLVGIFTERDVLEKVAEQFPKLADHPVANVMTADPLVVYTGDSAGIALAAIAAAGYRHVPVLNEVDQVVGIVSPRRAFAFLESRFESEST